MKQAETKLWKRDMQYAVIVLQVQERNVHYREYVETQTADAVKHALRVKSLCRPGRISNHMLLSAVHVI